MKSARSSETTRVLGGHATRRQFLRGLTATGGVLGAASLAGCGGAASAAGGDAVRFWTLLAGPDGILMGELLERVTRDTGVPVDRTTLAWGPPYYTKLAMASAGGRAPELGIMHLSRLQGYAPGGLLDPWDLDLLAEFGVAESDFPQAVVERTAVDGETFAVALDTHPLIMFVNTDVLDQAGLDVDAVSALDSPQAFLEAAVAMKDATGDIGISYPFINDGAQLWRLFYTFYAQHGVEVGLEPGAPPDFDRDVARECIALISEMVATAGNPGDGPTSIAEFQGGRSGALLVGDWELNGIEAAGLPYDAIPVPTLFGTPAAYADSHALVLPHQEDPDPEVRRRTHEVVAGMLKESALWAQAGHIPSFQPALETEEYAALEIQPHYAAAADNVVLDPPAWFTGAGSEFQNRVGQAMQSTFSTNSDPEPAIDRMVVQMQRLLDLPAPE